MTAVGHEVPGSRRGDSRSSTRKYRVWNAADEQDVIDWISNVSNVPDSLGDLPLADYSFEELEEVASGDYDVTATYGEAPSYIPVENQVDFDFNFQAPSAKIYQSLSTINSYGTSPPDFDGAINVVNGPDGMTVEGLDVGAPPETFTLTYHPATGTVDTTYQALVNGLVGTVNNASFKGYAAGELFLTRCTGGATSNRRWRINFGFSYIPNRTNIPVGGITVAAKDGHDLLWALYEDGVDANSPVKTPTAAYVERVFYRTNFSLLGI